MAIGRVGGLAPGMQSVQGLLPCYSIYTLLNLNNHNMNELLKNCNFESISCIRPIKLRYSKKE